MEAALAALLRDYAPGCDPLATARAVVAELQEQETWHPTPMVHRAGLSFILAPSGDLTLNQWDGAMWRQIATLPWGDGARTTP